MPTVTASPTAVSIIPDAGTVTWDNVNNALLSDGAFTTATASVPHLTTITSKAIKAVGFDFSEIGGSDTINSITVVLKRKSDRAFTNATVAYLVESGTVTGIFNESLSPYWGTISSEERLTKTLSLPSASVLKDSTSGIAISTTYYDADGADVTASIDSIQLEVSYASVTRESVSFSGLVGLSPLFLGSVGLRPYILGRVGLK